MNNENQKPLVSIICESYNHGKYLRDCLEGFVMQKTSFPFEILIHDDASTDNSQAIIKEYSEKYPQIFKPILQTENQYSKGVSIWHTIQIPRAKGKYIAFCEGDDYWTDPYKLEKQVSFLEEHPDYVLSHTSYNCYDVSKNLMHTDVSTERNNKDVSDTFEPNRILIDYKILTLTVVCRLDACLQAISGDSDIFLTKKILMGDTQLWYGIAMNGKIHYLSDRTSVYREVAGSATKLKDPAKAYRFYLSSWELRMYLAQRDSLDRKTFDYIKNGYQNALFKLQCFDDSYKPMFESDETNVKFVLKVLKRLKIIKAYLKWKIRR